MSSPGPTGAFLFKVSAQALPGGVPQCTAPHCLIKSLLPRVVFQKFSSQAGGAADKTDCSAEVPAKKMDTHANGLMNSEIRVAWCELREAMCSLFPLLKHFLSTYFVLGTVLRPEDPAYVNMMDRGPASLEVIILMARAMMNKFINRDTCA